MEQINSTESYSERYCGNNLKFSKIGHVTYSFTDEYGKHEIFNVKHNSTKTNNKLK